MGVFRILSIISILLVTSGCNTSTSDNNGGSNLNSSDSYSSDPGDFANTGTVKIAFKEQSRSFGTVQTRYLNDPSQVRIVIISDENSFKTILDYPVPNTVESSITVPSATDIQVYGISYRDDGTNKKLLKYGKQLNVSVAEGGSTDVSLILNPISLSLTYPSTIEGGQTATISISHQESLNSGAKYLYTSDTPIQTPPSMVTTSDADFDTFTYLTPQVDSETNIYMTTTSYLNSAFVKQDESFTRFRYYYPDSEHEDAGAYLTVLPSPEVTQLNVFVSY